MTDRVRAEDLVHELRMEFAKNLRTALGMTPALALEAADIVCEVWLEGMRGITCAGPRRKRVDGAAIEADWRAGRTSLEIARKHGCSRRTAYNYHPQRRVK